MPDKDKEKNVLPLSLLLEVCCAQGLARVFPKLPNSEPRKSLPFGSNKTMPRHAHLATASLLARLCHTHRRVRDVVHDCNWPKNLN